MPRIDNNWLRSLLTPAMNDLMCVERGSLSRVSDIEIADYPVCASVRAFSNVRGCPVCWKYRNYASKWVTTEYSVETYFDLL